MSTEKTDTHAKARQFLGRLSVAAVAMLTTLAAAAPVQASAPADDQPIPVEEPAAELSAADCEPSTVRLNFRVRMQDGTPVPGMVFDLPYPVCNGSDTAVGGTVRLTTSGGGEATQQSFPYIHCLPCFGYGMYWADFDKAPLAAPRLDVRASTAGFSWMINQGYLPETTTMDVSFEEDLDGWGGVALAFNVYVTLGAERAATPPAPAPPAPAPPAPAPAPPAPESAPPTSSTSSTAATSSTSSTAATPRPPATPDADVPAESPPTTTTITASTTPASTTSSTDAVLPEEADPQNAVEATATTAEILDQPDVKESDLPGAPDGGDGDWWWVAGLLLGALGGGTALYLARRRDS